MFMILPTPRKAAIHEEPAEETRARVKKACNRCRIKKSKCDGRMPCARCERDKVACRADRGPLDHKELSRSYIASLEQQQISLLNALRELNRRFPNERKVRGILEQLEASGFDVGPLEPPNEAAREKDMVQRQRTSASTGEPAMGDSVGLGFDSAGLLQLGPLLAHPEPLDPQTVADFLWTGADMSVQPEVPHDDQQDDFFTNAYTDVPALTDLDFASPAIFTTDGDSVGRQQSCISQDVPNMYSDISHIRGVL